MGKTLGPFPKTVRWKEIISQSLPGACPDELLSRLQETYEKLTKDEEAIRAITFLVALTVSSRQPDPIHELRQTFGINVHDPDDLSGVLDGYMPEDSLPKQALLDTLEQHEVAGDTLFNTDPWQRWREADGSAFCELARLFYTNLNRHYFADALQDHPKMLDLFTHEMSLITRSFSARWFNACARYQTPEQGSIVWYLGHCLGKLDLELARERSDWVEPTGNAWKRKKKVEASLGI